MYHLEMHNLADAQSRKYKTNDRSVSIVPNLSKVFEDILYKQISEFLFIFSRNIKQTLEKDLIYKDVSLLCLKKKKKERKYLDHRGEYLVILTDLLIDFDSLLHDLF